MHGDCLRVACPDAGGSARCDGDLLGTAAGAHRPNQSRIDLLDHLDPCCCFLQTYSKAANDSSLIVTERQHNNCGYCSEEERCAQLLLLHPVVDSDANSSSTIIEIEVEIEIGRTCEALCTLSQNSAIPAALTLGALLDVTAIFSVQRRARIKWSLALTSSTVTTPVVVVCKHIPKRRMIHPSL